VENYEKECFLESVSLFLSLFLRMQKQTFRNLQENPKGKPLHIQKKNRIASQTKAAFRCLDGAKYMKNSRDFSFLSPFLIFDDLFKNLL